MNVSEWQAIREHVDKYATDRDVTQVEAADDLARALKLYIAVKEQQAARARREAERATSAWARLEKGLSAIIMKMGRVLREAFGCTAEDEAQEGDDAEK